MQINLKNEKIRCCFPKQPGKVFQTCQNAKQPGRVVRPARVVSEIITDYYKNGWNYGVIRPARVVSETEFRVV